MTNQSSKKQMKNECLKNANQNRNHLWKMWILKNCIAKLTSQQKVNSIFFMSLLSNAKTSFVLNRGFHWVKKYEMMKRIPLISQAWQMSFQNKANNCDVVCKLISFIAAIRHFDYCSTQHSAIESPKIICRYYTLHSSPFSRQIRHCDISLVHLHKFMLNDFSVKSPWLTLSFVPTTTKHDNSTHRKSKRPWVP